MNENQPPIEQTETAQQAVAAPEVETREQVSLKTFLLLCVLWLPLAIFIWFALRSVIAYPLTRLAHWGLDWWLPGVIESTRQKFHYFEFTAVVPLPPGMVAEAGQIPAVDGSSNVLLFTYGLAVFWGLAMATPDNREFSLARRLRICLYGWLILIPVQAFSVVIDVGKILFINLGQAGLQMAAQHNVNLEVIAYFSQLTRLVVPTLSALIVWAIFHRGFIEHVRFDTPLDGEPSAVPPGPSRTEQES
jgi:uncharacterized RDD family membrane protein YckC